MSGRNAQNNSWAKPQNLLVEGCYRSRGLTNDHKYNLFVCVHPTYTNKEELQNIKKKSKEMLCKQENEQKNTRKTLRKVQVRRKKPSYSRQALVILVTEKQEWVLPLIRQLMPCWSDVRWGGKLENLIETDIRGNGLRLPKFRG